MKAKKSIAVLIALIMLIAMFPANILAANDDKTIKEFAGIDNTRTAVIGTSIDDLELPEKLDATTKSDDSVFLRVISWEVEKAPAGSTAASSSKFDKEGNYILKPKTPQNYDLAPGVELPRIGVVVKSQEEQPGDGGEVENPAVEIGGKPYASVTDAIADLDKGEEATIELLNDTTCTSNLTVDAGKKVTFDLNGNDFTLSTLDENALTVGDNSEITYKGQGEFNIETAGSNASALELKGKNAKATVSNITLKGDSVRAAYSKKVVNTGLEHPCAVEVTDGYVNVTGNVVATGVSE